MWILDGGFFADQVYCSRIPEEEKKLSTRQTHSPFPLWWASTFPESFPAITDGDFKVSEELDTTGSTTDLIILNIFVTLQAHQSLQFINPATPSLVRRELLPQHTGAEGSRTFSSRVRPGEGRTSFLNKRALRIPFLPNFPKHSAAHGLIVRLKLSGGCSSAGKFCGAVWSRYSGWAQAMCNVCSPSSSTAECCPFRICSAFAVNTTDKIFSNRLSPFQIALPSGIQALDSSFPYCEDKSHFWLVTKHMGHWFCSLTGRLA